MYDICIASIPHIAYNLPPAAPALLKGHLEGQGFTVLTKDYNIAFKHRINDDEALYKIIEYWFNNKFALSDELNKVYHLILDEFARDYISEPTRWLGISVFSPDSRQFCIDLLPYLVKYKHTNTRIVIGGLGTNEFFANSVKEYIDAYIIGEGEFALEQLLRENFNYPGINSPGHQVDEMDQIGFADYSDYNLEAYEHFYDGPAVQITGSRGCIRNCSFCNVADLWPKFRFKSGDLVAKEIISIYESAGTRHFFFTDSLINGNIKQLVAMMQRLSEYRTTTGADITWGGQWIARKQQGLPKDYYELIKRSGGFNLTIGVETGSDSVRDHMKKGFTNSDLDAELEQFSRHGITCSFFMIVGYPSESSEDFNETLRMFKRYVKYVADGTIVGVVLGEGFETMEGTPISREHGTTWVSVGEDRLKWKSLISNASYVENLRRRIVAQMVIESLRWPANDTIYELGHVLVNLERLDSEGIAELGNQIIDLQPAKIYEEYNLNPWDYVTCKITLTGNQGKSWPEVEILLNNQLYVTQTVRGTETLKFTVPNTSRRNILKIRLTNKSIDDTIVDDFGNIISDKNVVLNEIMINDVRIRPDDIYLQGVGRDLQGNRFKCNGLYANGDYRFYFENSVHAYFIRKQKYYFERNFEVNNESMQTLIKFYQDLSKSK